MIDIEQLRGNFIHLVEKNVILDGKGKNVRVAMLCDIGKSPNKRLLHYLSPFLEIDI
jgi:hypothetical protein